MLLHSASSCRSAGLLGSVALGLGLAFFAAAAGCSSDDAPATTDGGAGSGSGTEGGACPTPTPANGADDSCTDDGGPINQEATDCPTTPGDAGSDDAGAEEMYATHNGTASPDDDCKYDVSYTVDCSGGSTAFIVTLKSRTTGMLLTGANPTIEASMGDTHPLPSPEPVTTVVSDGVYKISGAHFDAPGIWSVRFHFFEMCLDIGETTKHAHVTFSVNVP
jgi:hypothetical protein